MQKNIFHVASLFVKISQKWKGKPRNLRKNINIFKYKIKIQCLCFSKPIKWLVFKLFFKFDKDMATESVVIGIYI